MLNGIAEAHNGKKWTEFPVPLTKSRSGTDFALWRRTSWPMHRISFKFHTTKTANQFKARKGQVDPFLPTPATKASNPLCYKDVLVIREQKSSWCKQDQGGSPPNLRTNMCEVSLPTSPHADSSTRFLCASKMEL
ncbi:hypothetical protein GGR50DRAFT_372161 [Xylaria sp. CBS 124048]|nr:hypothetical protein GGR50DRAFT_372161 [Xylaria sp. CBS 124048]